MADEKDFWEEDAKRLNDMAKAAVKAGVVVDVVSTKPPALNPDGSLKGEAGLGKVAKRLKRTK